MCLCVCVSLRSTATWPLDPSKEEKQGWRHIRIKQMGKNASGQTHYLSLSGLELYGTVTAVCEDQLGTPPSCVLAAGLSRSVLDVKAECLFDINHSSSVSSPQVKL